ncbi:hypothetical protein RchiOBHm_Chr1g0321461 [Rosa chinensis]|uniref:Uncharacterized protein n=1 Tax=Rosa chinensis TaxID=74649 RepID=A0A2P6S905_ROSCH|nr:hypothetical protein RchiOBHm_Chr1g0321461 [Rosa chinensis]
MYAQGAYEWVGYKVWIPHSLFSTHQIGDLDFIPPTCATRLSHLLVSNPEPVRNRSFELIELLGKTLQFILCLNVVTDCSLYFSTDVRRDSIALSAKI